MGKPKWTADPCNDAEGHWTVRPHDGSEHGDTAEQPVATVYEARNHCLISAAPDLYAALRYIVQCVDAGNEPLAYTVMEQARSALLKASGKEGGA